MTDPQDPSLVTADVATLILNRTPSAIASGAPRGALPYTTSPTGQSLFAIGIVMAKRLELSRHRQQGYDPHAIVVGVVPPAKADAAVSRGEEPIIG